MPAIGIELDGDTAVVADFVAAGAKAGAAAFIVTRTHGEMLRARIVSNASGRPGPRARTGDYRRSWSVVTYVRGGEISAEAGTNAPQGPRLEYGFTGTDALGRRYDQPPFPHARLGLTQVGPLFEAALAKIVDTI